jgi:nitrate reductase gamma subunit
MTDAFLFLSFPYVALILAVAVGTYRYFDDRFSYTALSSQLLENRQLFWGSVSWHYGIVIILMAHLLAALFPDSWALLFGTPIRLYVLEVTGLSLGFFTIFGIGLLIMRRIANPRLQSITSVMDWGLLVALLLQAASGVYVAIVYRWGAGWYVYTAVPWLWSLVRLDPQLGPLSALPWIVKFHFFNAFVLIALFPFTRLVHLFTVPITYLWRPYQVVIWNRRNPAGSRKRSFRS